jgi:hypothetical protein
VKSWRATGQIRGGGLPAAARAVMRRYRAMPGYGRGALAIVIAALTVLVPATTAFAGPAAGTTPALDAVPAQSSAPDVASATPVVLIGISGLRWTDLSPSATPALWRLAEGGSVGSLVVSGVRTFTCPAEAWLTVNSGARAIASQQPGPCRLPQVIQGPGPGPVVQARVPALDSVRQGNIEVTNKPYSYAPCWGVLASDGLGGTGCPPRAQIPSPGCTTAIGPGAALALANTAGEVQNYAAAAGQAPRSLLSRCPLTVVDLGRLPATPAGTSGGARATAVRAADQAAGRLIAAAPAGGIVVVAGMGDDSAAHLRAIIISGPGFGPGGLKATSTRQPGLIAITDLTSSILSWLGRSHTNLVGAVVTNSGRSTLTAAVRMLIGQDTAAQVYVSTVGWFLLIYGVTEFAVFCVLALALRGDDPERKRRRVAAYRICLVSAAAVPAGTFLARLVPWPEFSHPALWLYGLALAWAAVIALVALTGPWRRDPLGSAGFVCAVTVAVIAADVITGSHLTPSAPFGLSTLNGGRWYGIGNNALGVYAPAGIICATWAGIAGLRAGSRARALAAASAIAVVVLVACATPAFGAKVGGTIAMTPAFVLLLVALAGVRVTPLRAGLIAISGVVLITAFAVLSYIFPAVGVSDISAFVGHVLHGSAGPILNRKASANLHSVTETWFTPVVPLVVAVTGLMIAWPERLRLRVLARAMAAEPMLRPMLTAIWTAGVLGWLADDSGVSVTAAALPLALPLAVVIVTMIAAPAPAGQPGSSAEPGLAGSEGPVQAPGRQG